MSEIISAIRLQNEDLHAATNSVTSEQFPFTEMTQIYHITCWRQYDNRHW